MSDYVIAIVAEFVGPPGASDEAFERFIDTAQAEFEKISDGDLSIAASLTGRTADFSAVIPGESKDDALATFLVDLRTALHAAGCATPVWPSFAVLEQRLKELEAV